MNDIAPELQMPRSLAPNEPQQTELEDPNGSSPPASAPVIPLDELDPALRAMPYPVLFALFLKMGFLAWGGPMAQIDMLREHFIEQLGWISKARWNRVCAVYQALPGPEATELACYFGMLSRGRLGAIIAGLGFLLPGFTFMLIISVLYVRFGLENPIVNKSMQAVQPCVTAMVLRAVHRISETAMLDTSQNRFSIPLLLLAILGALASVAGINDIITLLYVGLLYTCVHRAQHSPSSKRHR